MYQVMIICKAFWKNDSLCMIVCCVKVNFHVRCSVHILNIIVQEGLKAASITLNKIREFVEFVKSLESMMNTFEECMRAVGNININIGMRLNVATHWNLTYLMLDSAIKYKKVFVSLQLNDNHYKYFLSI